MLGHNGTCISKQHMTRGMKKWTTKTGLKFLNSFNTLILILNQNIFLTQKLKKSLQQCTLIIFYLPNIVKRHVTLKSRFFARIYRFYLVIYYSSYRHGIKATVDRLPNLLPYGSSKFLSTLPEKNNKNIEICFQSIFKGYNQPKTEQMSFHELMVKNFGEKKDNIRTPVYTQDGLGIVASHILCMRYGFVD